MKKTLMIAAIMMTSIFSYKANAQVTFQVNIGVQPNWGPSGYDVANYYYMPDVDAYYDVNARNYVYMDCGRWITAACLPARFANFDLYRAHKVVINDARPWMRNDWYRNHYSSYRGCNDQVAIRDYGHRNYQAQPDNYNNRYNAQPNYHNNRAYAQPDYRNYNNQSYGERRNYGGRGRHNGWN